MTRFSMIATGLALVVSVTACGANKAELRKKEVASRDLGREYFLAGDYTTALGHLLEAEELYSNDAILHNYLGQTYFMKQKPQLAIKHYQKAIKLNPKYAVAKNNLGVVYLSLEQWDQAIAIFDDMRSDLLYATPHYPLSNLGYAYYRKGEYLAAEKFYLQALELKPSHLRSLAGLGRTYTAMGRTDEAVASLEKATQLEPRYVEAQFELARAYERLGNYQRAKAAYRKVIKLVPEKPLAKDAQAALQRLP